MGRLIRAFDGGKLSLAILAVSLIVCAALVAAELTGNDSLCATREDEIVFSVLVALSSGGLAACWLLRASEARLWPLAALCALCLILLLYFPVTPLSWIFLSLFVAIPLALYLAFPKGLALAISIVAAFFLLRFVALAPERLGQRAAAFRDMLAFAIAPASFAALISMLAAFRAELDRLSSTLIEVTRLNLSYQDYNTSLEEKTALEERLRLTRDIHDIVGYALTNTSMTLRAASVMCGREPEKLPPFLNSAREDVDRALGQVRETLREERRREIERAVGPKAIARAARSFKAATGVEVDVDYGNFGWAINGETALAASHFVQEGMLNAVSHGGASSIRVAFREAEGMLVVSVRDDGRGAKSLQEGIGIAGMRERAERLGGMIEYSTEGPGFSISMSLPLEGGAR